MRPSRALLQKIDALFEPRHLFLLPNWVNPQTLDYLLRHGYLSCRYLERSADGTITQAMNLELTQFGDQYLHRANCLRVAFVGTVIGTACVILISFLHLSAD